MCHRLQRHARRAAPQRLESKVACTHARHTPLTWRRRRIRRRKGSGIDAHMPPARVRAPKGIHTAVSVRGRSRSPAHTHTTLSKQSKLSCSLGLTRESHAAAHAESSWAAGALSGRWATQRVLCSAWLRLPGSPSDLALNARLGEGIRMSRVCSRPDFQLPCLSHDCGHGPITHAPRSQPLWCTEHTWLL